MTQKMRILAMVLLALAVAMAGIGGAVAALAAPTPASLAWAPTTSSGTYDFGTLATGATRSVTFTLTNTGGKASGSLRITLSGSAAFTITQNGCTGRSLGPKKSCTDTIEYAPKSSGRSESAMLTATGKSASANLTLSGKAGVGGVPTPNLTLSPGSFTGTTNGTKDYYYITSASATTFTVTNSGTSASETLAIECDGQPSGDTCDGPESINNDTCTNTSLAAGVSCTFELDVTFEEPCQSGSFYDSTEDDVVGTGVTYIDVQVLVNCP